jgi:hypothetical protein
MGLVEDQNLKVIFAAFVWWTQFDARCGKVVPVSAILVLIFSRSNTARAGKL